MPKIANSSRSSRLISSLLLWFFAFSLPGWGDEKPPADSTGQTNRSATDAIGSQGEDAPVLHRGVIFVPMDSWVYDALDRLASLGFVSDQAAGMRPWTRDECIRQINEAQRAIGSDSARSAISGAEAQRLLNGLRREFSRDGDFRNYVELESLYARYSGIGGKPLTDGYNFGQTIINDYGRPYGKGSNGISGLTVKGGLGFLSLYVRGEYQQSSPFFSPASGLRSQNNQLVPVQGSYPGGLDRFTPIEVYAGAQFGEWAMTVGKQELWWGPGQSGPLSFGTNTEPFYAFRFTRTTPLYLPGRLHSLGGFRIDLIGGELAGHNFPPRPLINGQKLTWNVTKSLEVGFTRWSLFGGAGVAPFTVGTVFRNLFSNGTTGTKGDPGDRKSGFDFQWHLPGNRATLYGDFYADDEPSPLTSFHRSAFSPGIYLPRVPGLSRWDLRVEAPSTRTFGSDHGGEFFYWNVVYRDANTNRGNLLGNWVGRDGRGLFVQTSHWFSAQTRLQLQYRQNRIGPAFLLGGGTQDDFSVSQSFQLTRKIRVQGTAQFERYRIPLLDGRRQDFLASLQIIYTPEWVAGQSRESKSGQSSFR